MADVKAGDPMFGKPVPCPVCHNTDLAVRLRQSSQLTGWLLDARLSRFDINSGNNGAFMAIRDYAHAPHGFLTLWGHNGVGKTHLLAALVNDLTAARIGAVYFTLPDLLDNLRRAVAREQFEQAYDRLANVAVLAIDELDKARMTDWAAEQVYRLVDVRYRDAHSLGTLFATNTDPAQMPDEIAYLASRLRQGRVILVGGPDMRPSVKGAT